MLYAVALVIAPAGREAVGRPQGEGLASVSLPAGATAADRAALEQWVAQARQRGARYIVLPELSLSRERPSGRIVPETVPGATTELLARLARQHGVWIGVSLAEAADSAGGFHVTAVLADERGQVSVAGRRVVLSSLPEGALAGDVDAVSDSVDTGTRRIGLLAGHDIEVALPHLAERGADTVLVSAGWPAAETQRWSDICRELAARYSVNVVVANDPGREGQDGPFKRGGVWPRSAPPAPGARGGGVTVVEVPPTPYTPQRVLGLPSLPVPVYRPLTPELVELGRRIFTDPRLSRSRKVSCASCHDPARGFTNGLPHGVGVFGRTTLRNVPTLLNVAFKPVLHWEGSAGSLEAQSRLPVSGHAEMDFHFRVHAAPYVNSQRRYRDAFKRLLGVDEVHFEHVARALGAYQRTLVSAESPFDRHYYGKDPAAMTPAAVRGLALFTGKAACAGCHPIGQDHALFSDWRYHATGAGYTEAGGYSDAGLGNRKLDADGLFLTPSLRNVALTAPYMHDGSLATLDDVIEFYNRGGVPSPNLDPQVRPLGLDESEMGDLRAFLEALTGAQRHGADGRPLRPAARRERYSRDRLR